MTTFLLGVVFMGMATFGMVQFARTPAEEPTRKEYSSEKEYRRATVVFAKRAVMPYIIGMAWLFGVAFVVAAIAYR